MLSLLPYTLLSLLAARTVQQVDAFPSPFSNTWLARYLPHTGSDVPQPHALNKRQIAGLETNPNGSTYVWTIEDVHEGKTFFDGFDFYDGPDPTHGRVNYTSREKAFAKNLSWVGDDGKVYMKGDDTTWLDDGIWRESVRISSKKQYNTGLFVLDLNKAPWGCAIWPAWWTLGAGHWPLSGEIDIIEGVHDNSHNQVAWHTGSNCTLNPNATFTGTIVKTGDKLNLDCNGDINDNAGCGVVEWSRASYGPTFDAQGGGVFAMKWDENGIAVWSFYRAAVPQDLINGEPRPSTWATPSAMLDPSTCDPITNFVNHSVIFDITFCGDWAGNSYATSGCPGTCDERLKDPRNFVNATWNINSMRVYRKQLVTGGLRNGATRDNVAHLVLLGVAAVALSFLLAA